MTDFESAPSAHQTVAIESVAESTRELRNDVVTSEEPLEISLLFGPDDARLEQTIAVTMRTPGQDADLAVGFLYSEGVMRHASELRGVEHCGPSSADKGLHNLIKVALEPGVVFDPSSLERNFYTTSSCGVCGKASIDAVRLQIPPTTRAEPFTVDETVLKALPDRLRSHQDEYLRTGGLHASGCFTADGRIDRIREDVGRHNALDKLIGSLLGNDRPPLADVGLILSGRISFELVQKAAMAGCPLIAAVGPPSSLAVELAVEQGMTLVGFLSASRFKIYSHAIRVTGSE
jgi:FdhD protein